MSVRPFTRAAQPRGRFGRKARPGPAGGPGSARLRETDPVAIPTRPAAGLGTACAVVLAGGAARRFGADKTAARLGPSTVLEHVLAGLPPDLPVVVVGPRRPLGRAALHWTLEAPPGGGPA